jgi:hypothetical protein
MGEVQDWVGENGKGEGERQYGEDEERNQSEENEVARCVIRRLRGGEANNGCRGEAASMDFHDEELDAPNLEVPDSQ